MKEKLSLIRKAYNFKQSQWLDPTKSFRTFLLEQKLGAKNLRAFFKKQNLKNFKNLNSSLLK